jgi:CDGSH-type Zn-finger protein
VNTIIVIRDGPLQVTGEIEIIAADGTLMSHVSETRLCRCGQSKNKPYCDGSHDQAEFRDGELAGAPPAPRAIEAGRLRIVVRPDGPLKVTGPCAVCATSGALVWKGNDTALCRCGQSNRKPFCDGTHRKIGFSAP